MVTNLRPMDVSGGSYASHLEQPTIEKLAGQLNLTFHDSIASSGVMLVNLLRQQNTPTIHQEGEHIR